MKTLNKKIRSSQIRKTPAMQKTGNNCNVYGNVYETILSLKGHMNDHETKCEYCKFTVSVQTVLMSKKAVLSQGRNRCTLKNVPMK